MLKTLVALGLSLFTLSLFAQDSTDAFDIKDFPLKDYEAPDLRYKRLDLGTNLNGRGGVQGYDKSQSHEANLTLTFSNYVNNKGFQGRNYAYYRFIGEIARNKDTISAIRNNFQNHILNYWAENRWYVSEEHFFAIHPTVNYWYGRQNYKSEYDTLSNNRESNEHDVSLSVVLSVGKGRIQPISPAREALNILISLEKYNRLAIKPDSGMIDSLAKISNKIRLKRFYDTRFRRIYQLEELDKGMQELGLVDNPDMVYAANLSDIWTFGYNESRGSGTRFELGLVPFAKYRYDKYHSENDKNDRSQEKGSYGGYAFVSWVKQAPVSFSIQSDFSVLLSVGLGDNEDSRYNVDYLDTSKFVQESLYLIYSIGYYPNTRTYIGTSPYAAISASDFAKTEGNEKQIGMNSGVRINGYYYFSPRLRMSINASCGFVSEGFYDMGPLSSSPLLRFSDYKPETPNLSDDNRFRYQYRIGLSYAIF